MKTIIIRWILSAALLIGLTTAIPIVAFAFNLNSGVNTHAHITTGWYDHQQIWYDGATVIVNAQAAAQLIKQGSVVFHIVNPDGSVPVFQTTFPIPPTGGVATDGNVLSAIPTEVGYTGGAWNLQIFHWNAPATRALTKDDDIHDAVTAGEGFLDGTEIVVRCPLVDFSNLR